jgi:hypothetical protein
MKKKIIFLTAILGFALFSFTNVKINTGTANNTSLLTLDKVEALGGVEFIVTAAGKVGISNPNPTTYILTVGTSAHTVGNAMLYGNSWLTSSDRRLKENIRDLDSALDAVLGLRGVSYYLKGDTAKQVAYGFIADEVQEILPEIVYADNEGYLALGYNNFVPLLAKAIQEQQATIEKQQEQIDELKGLLRSSIAKSPTDVSSVDVSKAVLYQNTPNPWKETTEIRYELPEGAGDASIYISDLSGKLLKTLPATGSGSVQLKGSDLKAGIYAYSLVVDGNIIDTKKFILTK